MALTVICAKASPVGVTGTGFPVAGLPRDVATISGGKALAVGARGTVIIVGGSCPLLRDNLPGVFALACRGRTVLVGVVSIVVAFGALLPAPSIGDSTREPAVAVDAAADFALPKTPSRNTKKHAAITKRAPTVIRLNLSSAGVGTRLGVGSIGGAGSLAG